MNSPTSFFNANSQKLAEIATGRSENIFSKDMEHVHATLSERLTRKRILTLGGAGSIGAATIAVLSDFNPACIHVIDHDENGLAELVRHLRSRTQGLNVDDFATFPIDFFSAITRRLLRAQAPYDLVLNFAAIKHVRSEKDPYSTLQMFETNILKQARFLEFLNKLGFAGRYFAVSTDKAANPSSMMGASKRAMEHVLFSSETNPDMKATVTSARFANVAFSNGSLLQAFEQRLKRGEPIAVPRGVRRYFVSIEEAGTLCTLASTIAEHNSIVIPRLDPNKNLVPLENIARDFLKTHGLTPVIFEDEDEARAHMESLKSSPQASGTWPLLVTSLDTAGEKPYEEFVGDNEEVFDFNMLNLEAVRYKPAKDISVTDFVNGVSDVLEDEENQVALEQLEQLLVELEPSFAKTHLKSSKNLDQRM